MNKKIALCIDSKCQDNPDLIDLTKVDLSQEWLHVSTDAVEFREYINRNKNLYEIWVLGSDNIEAINLAATVKKDRPDCVVCLVSFDMTGSLQSRATQANIDSVITTASLKERLFATLKNTSAKNVVQDFNMASIPQSSFVNSQQNRAFVISVMSASGGSGKSSVAVMCAVLCHSIGLKTLIIDADFQFGDIENLLGIQKPLRIDELIKNRSLVNKLNTQTNKPCLLAAPSLPELTEKVIEDFPAILNMLNPLFDVILINTGSFWGEQHAMLLERDNKSLFLIDQRPSSVNATKKAIDLCNRCGVATGSVLWTINKCSKHSIFTSIDISCALKGAEVAEIMDGGLDVDEILSSGNPQELIQNQNSFCVSLWSIMENILPKNVLINTKSNIRKSKRKSAKYQRKHVNKKTTKIERA